MPYEYLFLFWQIGIKIAILTNMSKSQNADFVRYEYIVYFSILETYNVSEILLTKDDFIDKKPASDQTKWIPVENLNVDIVDTTKETGNSGETSISKIMNRICGLFDAEPLDWKYAKITIYDDTNTRHNIAVARMPRSPIVPVVFNINK